MKKHFTLLELLIVIAIIGILLSLLLPSLNNSRKKAIQAVCLSNMSQSSKSLLLYSKSNDWVLPGTDNPSTPHTQDLYHNHKTRNLLVELGDLMDWSSWECAELPNTVDVNDASNNRVSELRGDFQYWTRMRHTSGNYVLSEIVSKNNPENAFISDGAYIWNSASAWRTNHDSGSGTFWNGWSDNPSFMFYKNGTPRGINQIYAGGHGKWNRFSEMTVLATVPTTTFYGAKDSTIVN